MDKSPELGARKILIPRRRLMAGAALLCLFLLPAMAAGATGRQAAPGWMKLLRKRVSRLDSRREPGVPMVRLPGQLGLYVKDLSTGHELSFRGEERWYIASGVKVPIALEVLRQVDAGVLSLETRVTLTDSDYMDGAGETNFHKPGSALSVRFLLEQMLIHSDNTASDLLIRLVGIRRINRLVRETVPGGFSRITTLSDVRRHVYSAFHPAAFGLRSQDLLVLRSVSGEPGKISALAGLLKLPVSELRPLSLDSAYSTYYSGQLNSASLRAYGRLLEGIVTGGLLRPESLDFLMRTLSRVETGEDRIKAGLAGSSVVFAHKTGTQHARVCDFGIAWDAARPEGRRVVVAACARGFRSLRHAERALKSVGEAIKASGLFPAPPAASA